MIDEYLREFERSRGEILGEMEAVAKEKEFPIIGPRCGRKLMILAKAVNAKRVFEMGSGFGYSTIWFAHAVGADGLVVHTDGDANNTSQAKDYIARAGFSDRVRFETGDAVGLLAGETELFDVILIDIDKKDYPTALETAVPKLREGGFILTHNTIWSNRVADPNETGDDTEGIRKYNKAAYSHPELATFIDPIDDGLGISLKVGSDFRRTLPI